MLREKSNLSWSFQACPIWWRGESVKCEYVWSEIQQLPLSVALPSDSDLTSSWCKAAGCGHEVMGSDAKALTAEKWDMTIFLCVFRAANTHLWSYEMLLDRAMLIMGISIYQLCASWLSVRGLWKGGGGLGEWQPPPALHRSVPACNTTIIIIFLLFMHRFTNKI